MAQEKRSNKPAHKPDENAESIEKLVSINRTTKVVKGGRRFGFSALVVVGDGKGRIGVGKGKAKEVADARRKATEAARKSMIKIPLREGRTIHHDIKTKAGAGGVILRTAGPGTGIIAGGPMRAIFEALGVKDVVAKSFGSSNPYNMVASTMKALQLIQSPKATASRRGKKITEIVAQRELGSKASAASAADATAAE